MANNSVCWWEIGAKDSDNLVDFYKKAFGWEINKCDKTGYNMVASGCEKDGPGIGGGIFSVEGKCPPYFTIYVEVEDVDKKIGEIKKLGGELIGDAFDIPEVGRIAMFKDLEGNTIGLIKPLPCEK